MDSQDESVETARRYFAAIERGAVGDELAAFFTPDVVQEEFPNRLLAGGARRDLDAILDAAVRGQKVMSAQRIEVLSALATGEDVALSA